MRKFDIWNEQINMEDWVDFLLEEFPESTEEEILNDPEAYRRVEEMNYEYLSDERANLNINMGSPIIVIADLGLWNGRQPAYKIIESGNIADCFYSLCRGNSSCHWYIDTRGDLCCDESHHDGVNHYRYRAVIPCKSGGTQRRIDNMGDKIMTKVFTREYESHCSKRLGDAIAEVYGWHIFRGSVQK